MDLDDYQEQAEGTAVYPGQGQLPGLMYVSLGLTGEAGEVANKVKKAWRDELALAESRNLIRAEIGDVLWYIAQLCTELRCSLNDVAEANLAQLADRQARGVLSGSGDER